MPSSETHRLPHLSMRNAVFLLLSIAAALRVLFLVRAPAAPLFWDEPYYDYFASSYAGALTALMSGEGSSSLMAAFAQGLEKGELYSVGVGLLYWLFGQEPRLVFWIQGILDVCNCYLIFVLAARLSGGTAGLVALGIAALYEPFIFTSGRLQTETLASFLYLSAICIALRPGVSIRSALASGLLLGLGVLTKPALRYVPLIFVAIHAFRQGHSPRRRIELAAALISGWLLILGARQVAEHNFISRIRPVASLDPASGMFAGSLPENLGWLTSDCCTPSRLRSVLGGAEPVRPTNQAYRRAVLRIWTSQPLATLRLWAHKIYRAWHHPYNDLRRLLWSTFHFQTFFHQMVLLFGALGLFLAIIDRTVGRALAAVALYLWAIQLPMPIEPRYTITLMPLMVVFAGSAATVIAGGLQRQLTARGPTRFVSPAAIVVGAVLLILAGRVPIGMTLAVLPGCSPVQAHGLQLGVQMVAGMSLACGVVALLRRADVVPSAAVVAVTCVGLVAAAAGIIGRDEAVSWRRWRAALAPGQSLRQEFALPGDLAIPRRVELKVDAVPEPSESYGVRIIADGRELHRYSGGLHRGDADLPSIVTPLATALGEDRLAPHAWYAIPIDVGLLVPGRPLSLEIQIDGQPGSGAVLTVLGDYAGDDGFYEGPSVLAPEQDGDLSLNKFLVTRDPRLTRRTPTVGAAVSHLNLGAGWLTDDLSPAPGVQSGRYRIFLVLEYSDRTVVL